MAITVAEQLIDSLQNNVDLATDGLTTIKTCLPNGATNLNTKLNLTNAVKDIAASYDAKCLSGTPSAKVSGAGSTAGAVQGEILGNAVIAGWGPSLHSYPSPDEHFYIVLIDSNGAVHQAISYDGVEMICRRSIIKAGYRAIQVIPRGKGMFTIYWMSTEGDAIAGFEDISLEFAITSGTTGFTSLTSSSTPAAVFYRKYNDDDNHSYGALYNASSKQAQVTRDGTTTAQGKIPGDVIACLDAVVTEKNNYLALECDESGTHVINVYRGANPFTEKHCIRIDPATPALNDFTSNDVIHYAYAKLLHSEGNLFLVMRGTSVAFQLHFVNNLEREAVNSYESLPITTPIRDAIPCTGGFIYMTEANFCYYNAETKTSTIIATTTSSASNTGVSSIAFSQSHDLITTHALRNASTGNLVKHEVGFSSLPYKKSLLRKNVGGLIQIPDAFYRGWHQYHTTDMDNIASCIFLNKGTYGVFVCTLTTNKLLNITVYADGTQPVYQTYTEDSSINKADSQLYFAANNVYFTDGTNAYLVNVASRVYSKSTDAAVIPASAIRSFFTTAKSSGRRYCYVNSTTCLFVERNRVSNYCKIYRLTGNSMSALTLASTTTVNGVTDLSVQSVNGTGGTSGRITISATVNGKLETVTTAVTTLTTTTYSTFAALVSGVNSNTRVVNEIIPTALSNSGARAFSVLTEDVIQTGTGIISRGTDGVFHMANTSIRRLSHPDIPKSPEIVSADGGAALCGIDQDLKRIYISGGTSYPLRLFRGTVKIHAGMRSSGLDRLTITVPISNKYKAAEIIFQSRHPSTPDLRSLRIHARISGVIKQIPTTYTITEASSPVSPACYMVMNKSATTTNVYYDVTTSFSANRTTNANYLILTMVYGADANNPAITDETFDGMFLDYYAIGIDA